MEENSSELEKKQADDHEYLDYYEDGFKESEEKKESLTQGVTRGIGYEVFTWIRDLVLIVIVVLLFTNFVAERTKVIGASMEPNIHDGDQIFIDKLSFRFSEPERYDVVVFPYHKNPSLNYIKRIIALPGETVNIVDQKVYINGKPLNEEYGKEPIERIGNQDFPMVVPEEEYFVLGDNRNDSSDSRYKDVGTISKDEFLGKAGLRIWPLSDFGFIE